MSKRFSATDRVLLKSLHQIRGSLRANSIVFQAYRCQGLCMRERDTAVVKQLIAKMIGSLYSSSIF